MTQILLRRVRRCRGSNGRPRLFRLGRWNRIGTWSYKTLEVQLENGRVRSLGTEALPAKAHALLTMLPPDGADATNAGAFHYRIGG